MGAEADCTLSANGERHSGRALLETDALIFRGADGYRVSLPLASMRNARAVNGELRIDDLKSGPIILELGDKAERWAERIRSPKALIDKLDVKPEHAVALIGGRDDALARDLGQRAAKLTAGRAPKGVNVVFLWADTLAGLDRLESLSKRIARDGAIWVIHPKGPSSKVKDTDIFAAARKSGLTATKVARFSDTHTAEKLVIPVARR